MRSSALTRPLLLLAAVLLAACSEARGGDEAFGQRVRAYLLENPEVLEEAIQRLDQKRAQTAAATQSKALVSNRKAVEQDPRDPVVGNGPITVVEFFDYRCGYCKTAAPAVVDLVRTEPDVRVVFKELPILPDRDGRLGVSERAARLALAAKDTGKYLEVHRDLMAEKALDDAGIARIARKHGLDPVALARAGQTPAVDDHLSDTQELARSLGVEGTPAFVVGDTMIPGADIAALRAAIAQKRGGRTAGSAAGTPARTPAGATPSSPGAA
jgi:protein-disulfide isomerase